MPHRLLHKQISTRHETLALLRVVAIFGQTAALIVAWAFFDIVMNYGLAALIIGAWLTLTIVQVTILGRGYRLPASAIFILLVVDLMELSVLLFIAGGINNPFAILMIVPVVLAANTLDLRFVIVLAVVMICALLMNLWFANEILREELHLIIPPILRMGHAVAIVVSMLFLSFFARRLTQENLSMTRALAASELALQREHRLASLGGLVAAYAHELGTPLASIRLASDDVLDDELSAQTRSDVEQIKSEAKRCAQILANMGKIGKDDALIRTVPISALVEEAAAPHLSRGKEVSITVSGARAKQLPLVSKSSAIIHGLRNIIQNAVDFANAKVEVEIIAEPQKLLIRVSDDGEGYAADVVYKIGEPYIRSKMTADRAGYEGMGLGLFISKTLIETTGAKMTFANRPKLSGTGAIVTATWKMRDIEVGQSQARESLGSNQEQSA